MVLDLRGTKQKWQNCFLFFQLITLSFNHCEMSEYRPNGDPNSDAEYDRRQSFLAMARDAFELMTKFEKIENLSILSTCSTIHLRMLMSHCPNVKQVNQRTFNRGNDTNEYSQTWVNDHLSSVTSIFGSHFHFLKYKTTSEQRPPVNNDHKSWVPMVVVVHKLD